MSLEQALDKYGSYQEVINATVGSNPGMDACIGLYDIYHGGKQDVENTKKRNL